MYNLHEIIENRRKAVKQLRDNPSNYYRCDVNLDDGCGGRCALGVICEALDIDVSGYSENPENYQFAYDDSHDLLFYDVSIIYSRSDSGDSFDEMADFLERVWGL